MISTRRAEVAWVCGAVAGRRWRLGGRSSCIREGRGAQGGVVSAGGRCRVPCRTELVRSAWVDSGLWCSTPKSPSRRSSRSGTLEPFVASVLGSVGAAVVEMFSPPRPPKVLNEPQPKVKGAGSVSKDESGADVAASMRSRIMMLYGSFLQDDGSTVNYSGLRASTEFEEYCSVASRLSAVDPRTMPAAEKLAFFMNVYNSLLIHAMAVADKPPTSVLGRLRFYARVRYNIGGLIYSLNDIENGVLRANAKPPAPWAQKLFKKNDPRLEAAFTDANKDERIHFALNCGAKSCPPVRFFTPENVHQTLANAACGFVLDDMNVHIDEKSNSVALSSIFAWYREDFTPKAPKSDSALLRKLASYLEVRSGDKVADQRRKSLLRRAETGAKVTFATYDWSLNETEESRSSSNT